MNPIISNFNMIRSGLLPMAIKKEIKYLCPTTIIRNSKRVHTTSDEIKCCTPQSDADAEKEKELEKIAKDASIDEPPTACCQSGCANCVFIVWAETLTKKMDNAGPEIAEKILKMVEDPSMKAYLELELRMRGLRK